MGSPTVPRIRKDFRDDIFTKSSPKDCSALMAVGAVYSSVTYNRDFLHQLQPLRTSLQAIVLAANSTASL